MISRTHMMELQKQGSRALLLRKGQRSLSVASMLVASTSLSLTSAPDPVPGAQQSAQDPKFRPRQQSVDTGSVGMNGEDGL